MAKGAIKAVIATQYDGSGLKKAQKDMAGFGKSIKGVLGTLGVATSVSALAAQLVNASKAAAQDAKSFAVMANTIKNVTNASDGAISASDKFIQKLQMQVGIADDQLRPVFSKLVTVTGDLTKSQDLLGIAADLAAAKNIDLSTAGNALAKAVGGQTTALFRLAPELKKSSDWMTTLKNNTKGAAEAAANTDPFQRITVILGEMSEKIGYALLPAFEAFADWLASDAVQAGLDNIAADLDNFVVGLGVVGNGVNDAVKIINDGLNSIGVNLNLNNVAANLDLAIFGPLQKAIQLLGALQNAKMSGPDETSRLIRRRLESLGTVTSIDTGSGNKNSGATKKITTANEALTKAVNAAKAAFDAKVKAYQDAVKAAQDVIDSTKEITASFVDLFKVTPQMGEFESAAVDGFKAIYEQIQSAFKGGQLLKTSADALTKYADTSIAAMQAIAKQRDILAKKIDIARTITAGVTGLANITGMLETTTEAVTTSVRTMANGIETIITKTADVTTTGGLIGNFQKLVDKTKAFAANLISLKKLGLNKNLFAQLVNAGAEAGGATAQALVDGGSDTIKAMNDLYTELDKTAGEIAKESTDIMYQVGEQIVSNGFIEGLVSQADALAATAKTMAQTFADAFNSQLAAALQVALPAVPMPDAGTDGLDLSARPDPKRSPQRYAAWLAGIGGIDPIRSPQSYAAAQKTINVTLNTGVVTSSAQVGSEIVSFIKSYERASGSVWQTAQ